MKRSTNTIEPLDHGEPPLTYDLLRRIDRELCSMFLIPPSLLNSMSAFDVLERRREEIQPAFVQPAFTSWLGSRVILDPYPRYRPAEKPLRSRPCRRCVQTPRTLVRAKRVSIRGRREIVSWLKPSRKVPDRTGYPHGTVFVFNPSAIFNLNSIIS